MFYHAGSFYLFSTARRKSFVKKEFLRLLSSIVIGPSSLLLPKASIQMFKKCCRSIFLKLCDKIFRDEM